MIADPCIPADLEPRRDDGTAALNTSSRAVLDPQYQHCDQLGIPFAELPFCQ